ncbi:proline-rich membrane anchor 1 isoform X2 [Callorhinchus milii]|uniref:proline-rich membrane anchor 1 isoform X2 n=1 Tax=Callorhinchus milii TaxID=7868 RepID=UPI0004575365|nr:proline-rich membrane anchor 1 isoform X2 [Callorhinchus milii]|eukprot:gi/632971202/ref/XP_007902055.1/ PREDICTED: proline-rich membrane anchor 1 [Callorhinchus milii]
MLAGDLPLGPCSWTIAASLLLLCQLSQGELQRSCARSTLETDTESCHEICPCRPPPLPPPPPPPPPPRLVFPNVESTDFPPLKSWWTDMVILIAVGGASLAFLIILVIICYKAIKRKSNQDNYKVICNM